jgi:hypothetical protein
LRPAPEHDSPRTIRRFLIIIFAVVASMFAWHAARAHDMARPDLDGWFMGLSSKIKSPCCDGSDALRLDDVDWETKDGHYRVRLENEWVDVPDSAVVNGPNRAGPTMVWPYRRDGHLNQIRCFLPGSMT